MNIIVHDDGSSNGLDERLVGGRRSGEYTVVGALSKFASHRALADRKPKKLSNTTAPLAAAGLIPRQGAHAPFTPNTTETRMIREADPMPSRVTPTLMPVPPLKAGWDTKRKI